MTDRPHRVQLRRTKGWRMPPNTVIVDRRNKTYGNPYPMLENTQAERVRVVELFEIWFIKSTMRVYAARDELRGKNLACWCPLDQPCHADVLLQIVNELSD